MKKLFTVSAIVFFLITLISSGAMATTAKAGKCHKNLPWRIFCRGAICRRRCMDEHPGSKGKCQLLIFCRCTWDC
ncbi:hypothetical protein AMTRI_Chr02g211750 [Amborella trichopoda]